MKKIGWILAGNIGVILAVIFSLIFCNTWALHPTAYQVIKAGEDAMRGRTSASTVKIIVERPRFKRTMLLKSYDDRVGNRFFIRILKPKKDKNVTFLKLNSNLWQYIPKIGKEIKIEASLMQDSWMGSDFSNDDLVKQSSIIDDYRHSFLEYPSKDFHKIQLIPKPGAPVVWSKVIIYSRKKDSLPVKEEFYDHKGRLKKIMLLTNIKKMGGRVIPSRMVMGTVRNGKVKSKTTMIYLSLKYNLKLKSRIFSRLQMRKYQ